MINTLFFKSSFFAELLNQDDTFCATVARVLFGQATVEHDVMISSFRQAGNRLTGKPEQAMQGNRNREMRRSTRQVRLQ